MEKLIKQKKMTIAEIREAAKKSAKKYMTLNAKRRAPCLSSKS